jgi:hypothetical protein
MKKIILIILVLSSINSKSQDLISQKHNEVRLDVVQLLALSKYSISYERFWESDFSAGLNVSLSDSNKLERDFKKGYTNNLSKIEINPFVRYALSKSKTNYYFAELFVSYNGGDFKEIIRTENNSTGYYTTKISSYSDIGAGCGLGYKMYIKEALAIEILVAMGYNLLNTDKSPDKISRVGINLGYRF